MEETTLKLKLEQETERLRKAQETLNATAKDRAWRAREAFGTAENTVDMRSAQRHVETLVRALSMNKSAMERLRDRKSRPNRPGLTRSRPKDSRVGNRAAHAALDWEQRGCSKSKEATDSARLIALRVQVAETNRCRVSCARRREKTLALPVGSGRRCCGRLARAGASALWRATGPARRQWPAL